MIKNGVMCRGVTLTLCIPLSFKVNWCDQTCIQSWPECASSGHAGGCALDSVEVKLSFFLVLPVGVILSHKISYEREFSTF